MIRVNGIIRLNFDNDLLMKMTSIHIGYKAPNLRRFLVSRKVRKNS